MDQLQLDEPKVDCRHKLSASFIISVVQSSQKAGPEKFLKIFQFLTNSKKRYDL